MPASPRPDATDRLLTRSPRLACLGEDARRALATRLESRALSPGQALSHDDEPLDALVLVTQGAVELRRRGAELRAPVAVRLGVGALIGPAEGCCGLRALDSSRVLQAPRASLDALSAEQPELARLLADLRLQARSQAAALSAMRRSAVLRRASTRELVALVEAGWVERLPALQPWLAAGSHLDGIRVLIEGEVFARSPQADATVRLLGAGDLVGDLELVSGREQPVDLVAGPRGAVLLAVPEAAVLDALRSRPLRRAVMAGSYGSAQQRRALVERVAHGRHPAEILALEADQPGLPLPTLAQWLGSSLRRQFRDRVAVVTAGEERPPLRDEQGVVQLQVPAGGDPRSHPALATALRQADLVILVAEGEAAGWSAAAERVSRLWTRGPWAPVAVEATAVLPHEVGVHLPTAVPRLPRSVVEAARRREEGAEARADVDRWARALTDRRVGLALGGGGALALGHAALLRALHAAELPVDLVAGVSGGAVVGAFYATAGLVGLDALEHLGPALGRVQQRAWLSSRPVARFLAPHLGRARLEDLALPLFPVVTDVDRGVQLHLRHGSVATAVRASGSFPGTFGPTTLVVQGSERRLVDGGVVNLVPDDTAALEGARVVLASNVLATPRPRLLRDSRLPPALARHWRRLDPRLRFDDVLRAANQLLHAPVDFDTRPCDVRLRTAPAPWSPADWGAARQIARWHEDDAEARARIEGAVAELQAAVRALRWKRVRPERQAAPRLSVGMTREE